MQGFPHSYQVSATGESVGAVALSSNGLPDMDTQPPPEFGGPEGFWSPETLLTAAVANCFILSFRAIARASKLEWSTLDCSVEGVLDRPERITLFTRFNLDVVLRVPQGANTDMAERLLQKAEQICLITASLRSDITLATDIQVD